MDREAWHTEVYRVTKSWTQISNWIELLLGRKGVIHLDSLLKSIKNHVTLLTWVYSQSYGFSSSHVWMWELDHKEGWTPNNWCFQILIRLLRVHWTIRRLKQSILKETNPEYSLERLMLKRKLQYFGHLMWRTDSFEKTLMLGRIEGQRRREQRMRWLDAITESMDMSLSKLRRQWRTGKSGMLQSMGSWRVGHNWET